MKVKAPDSLSSSTAENINGMPEESENFRKLADFFRQKAEPVSNAGTPFDFQL